MNTEFGSLLINVIVLYIFDNSILHVNETATYRIQFSSLKILKKFSCNIRERSFNSNTVGERGGGSKKIFELRVNTAL